MASRARSIVVNGLFFIFKSGGEFTDSYTALSNSFFALEASKIFFLSQVGGGPVVSQLETCYGIQ